MTRGKKLKRKQTKSNATGVPSAASYLLGAIVGTFGALVMAEAIAQSTLKREESARQLVKGVFVTIFLLYLILLMGALTMILK